MIEINKRAARTMARMGPRPTYGQAISRIGAANSNVIALSADLGRSSGLDRFSREYPDQFINTGIAEQNMVGIAAGLARTGFTVFASTFAPFASMRASEQVRMNMGYMEEPVKLVALGSGLAMGYLGNSHYGLEDLAVMQAIPGLTIISPADCIEIYKVLEACVEFNGPVYIRLTGALNSPIVYENEYDFIIGKAVTVREGGKVTLISAGTTVGQCLSAANLLAQKGIETNIINMHTIKPLDAEALDAVASVSSQLFVIEEHTMVGGLGSAILAHFNKSQTWNSRIHCHGICDRYVATGDYPWLLAQNKLDAAGIAEFVETRLA